MTPYNRGGLEGRSCWQRRRHRPCGFRKRVDRSQIFVHGKYVRADGKGAHTVSVALRQGGKLDSGGLIGGGLR